MSVHLFGHSVTICLLLVMNVSIGVLVRIVRLIVQITEEGGTKVSITVLRLLVVVLPVVVTCEIEQTVKGVIVRVTFVTEKVIETEGKVIPLMCLMMVRRMTCLVLFMVKHVENIVKVGKNVMEIGILEGVRLLFIFSKLVVVLPLSLIGQRIVRLGNFAESIFGTFFLILIWVILDGQLSECLLYFLFGCVASYTENFVIILLGRILNGF